MLLANLAIIVSLTIVGCSSSKQSSEGTSQTSSTATSVPSKETQHDQADTSTVSTSQDQSTSSQTPAVTGSTPSTSSTGSPAGSGMFAVQIGANKVQSSAEHIAQLARERFTQRVDIFYDAPHQLYKVMIGNFLTREDARSFRDELFRKYPTDYKDAWASERPQQ